jgi:amino-acid N-acetyltransferase
MSHVSTATLPREPRARLAVLRTASAEDVPDILALIADNLESGHLLPRSIDDVARHVDRFVVAALPRRAAGSADASTEAPNGDTVIGCAELAPLSRAVAEVRSLVVRADARGQGVGSQLLRELGTRARRQEFSVLCAFAHDPHPFVRLGFSIAPHVWFPEKVALDCTGCAKFRVCGQHAMALPLTEERSLPSPHRLREPLTASSSRTRGATLPPIRLRVIA